MKIINHPKIIKRPHKDHTKTTQRPHKDHKKITQRPHKDLTSIPSHSQKYHMNYDVVQQTYRSTSRCNNTPIFYQAKSCNTKDRQVPGPGFYNNFPPSWNRPTVCSNHVYAGFEHSTSDMLSQIGFCSLYHGILYPDLWFCNLLLAKKVG